MKKTLLLSAALLALSASLASAAGINFGWNDCGGGPSSLNKTFACNSNTLSGAVLVGSYIPPAGSSAITGEEIVIDLVSSSASLPAWWQFKNAGSCRQTALSTSADFTSGPFTCADYWTGLAAGGATAYITPYAASPNRARLLIIYATAIANAQPVDANLEYYAFKATMSGAKTVGAGACAGCADPVCLVLNEIKLTQPAGVGDYRIQAPAQRNYATWQGGVVGGGCPAVVPTQNRTWGSVKALYR
ncbi:MAG: hypothetical protein HZA61_15770 [Candidatus Eisenbacteria bacterium]|uniref:Uncharacterized protein n=1 Tax=Eiseniibacteriota bacterium TaxID=2212470 RepID=A0A933SIJ8_UNCEI|nr:hypothetical protein [Candidatus Eisenbacteria bacterium]